MLIGIKVAGITDDAVSTPHVINKVRMLFGDAKNLCSFYFLLKKKKKL